MKRGPLLAISALLVSACFAPAAHAVVTQYHWTGVGNGWRGQVLPPGDGTAELVFGDSVRWIVPLPGNFIANSLRFTHDDDFQFVSSTPGTPLTLTLNNGVIVSIPSTFWYGVHANFSRDITVNIALNQNWHFGHNGAATLHGPLTGTGNLTFTGSGHSALILNNLSATASTYSGILTLSPDPNAPSGTFIPLVVWGNNSLGTGTVRFTNGGMLILHSAPNLANTFILGEGPLRTGQTAPDPILLRTWDAPTATAGRLTGTVTLANHTTLQPIMGWANKIDVNQPNNTGSIILPGPLTRHPLVISGNVGESVAGRGLHVTGPGVVILSGTSNTYTGGTFVGFPVGGTTSQGGSLVFGSLASLPATGFIQSGLLNTSGASGYIGIAASAVAPLESGFQNSFLSRIAPGSSGAVGVDTLPGQATQTFSDSINLGVFNTTAANGIRLGTATSAIIAGAITPQIANIYHFGNGGGRLTVESGLVDNVATESSRSLLLSNNGVPLELILRGTNTYSGGTTVTDGILVFETHQSLPTIGALRAGGSATATGRSYIGMGSLVELAASTFLGRFDKPNTWGTIGFDGGRSVANLDLTGFNDGVYLGTSSTATLGGTIKPTTLANTSNAANTLRFTAAAGGTLTVSATLADIPQPSPNPPAPLSVVIGVPVPFHLAKMSDGTVVLSGANTYTGGTTLHGSFGGITAAAGTNSAFGTGTVTLAPGGGMIGLSTTAPGLNLPNNFVFATPASGSTTPNLFLTGTNPFTLSGRISGPAYGNATGVGSLSLAHNIAVTLTGDNSGFHGFFRVANGLLKFEANAAAGKGALEFEGSGTGVAAFNTTGAASAPVLYGLSGALGTLQLGANTNLTINLDNPHADYDFGGVITGVGNVPTNARLTITGSGLPNTEGIAYLYGSNQYTGGTTITGTHSGLALGRSDSAGTGPITINSLDGGLLINTNVRLTNPLTLTAGGLGGLGTFAPTSFNGVTGGPFVIGPNTFFLPGAPWFPGALTFAGNTVFNNGGTYEWLVIDPTHAEGYSLLNITGSLDLRNLTAGGFTMWLETIGPGGQERSFAPSIVWGQSYSLRIISATGGVLGFQAANFALDVRDFQLGQIPLQYFSVTADANNVYLNFTAVPEPSTWALMLTGAAFLGLTWYRRRRA